MWSEAPTAGLGRTKGVSRGRYFRLPGCWRASTRQDLEGGAQKRRQPAQQEGEIIAGGGEHGVGAIAVKALEVIAVQSVLGLQMADDRLDCGAAFHLAADLG
jgi:hypothetical protein